MAVPLNQSTRIGGTSDGAVGASTTTAAFSWSANELLIMSVASGDTGGAPAAPTSITGGSSGLTFTLIDSQTAGNVCCSVWRAMSSSSGSGTTVITWATGTDSAIHSLEGFGGAMQGGSNGSAAIVQSTKTNAGSQTAMTMNFGATPRTDSLILAACNHNDTAGTMTAGTNFIGVADNTQGTPSQHLYVEENPNGSASATVTLTSSVAGSFGFVAIEIAPLTIGRTAGASDAGAIASAEAFGSPGVSLADIYPAGAIASAEAFGSPTLSFGLVGLGGIASAEAFGVPFIGTYTGVWPGFFVECAFGNQALDADANVVWTDLTNYCRGFRLSRSRSREQARFDAGSLEVILDNRDGSFSPEHSGSQFFPYVRPNKRVRVRASHGGTLVDLINCYADSWSERFAKPNDAIVALSATDAFKLLARYQMPDSWQLVVASLLPLGWYRLDERAGTTFYNSGSGAAIDASMTTPGSITLGGAPLVPGADTSVSASATFASTSEGSVASPGVIPTTTSATSVTFRSAAKAYNLSDPFSLYCVKPAGVILDDILLAFVGYKGSASVDSVPSGWNLIRTDSTGSTSADAKQSVYWKKATNTEPSSYTWHFDAGGDIAIIITAWIGAHPTSPVDVSGATTNASSAATTCAAASVTTTSTNEMLVTGHFFNPSTTSSSAISQSTPSGMTERADTASKGSGGSNVNSATMSCNTLSVTAAGATGAKTTTISSDSGRNVGSAVALKPAPGGVGAVPTPFTVAFWFSQTAHQTSNADFFIKQGSQFVIYQDSATNKLSITVGGLTGALTPVPSLNTAYLIVARYDGATGFSMGGSGGLGSVSGFPSVTGLTPAAFEFGQAQATMDEVTVWPRYLSTAEVAALQAVGLGTATSAAVVGQALDQVGWASDLRQIQATGAVTVSNLTTASNAGDKVLDYLQSVATTERGVLYVAHNGKLAFETLAFLQTDTSRITPSATFGQGGGEIGYADLTPDYSDQIIINDVEVTNTTTDAGTRVPYAEKYSKTDQASISEFSTYTLPLSTNYDAALATRQAAIQARMTFELDRYSQPQRRIESIAVTGTATAADWDTLLGLTMLNRVTVNHVTPYGATISKDYTIRAFQWEYTANPKSVKLTLGLDEGAV